MFIVCSNCDFKYLINSADLKPNGRMVECANCGHQWFQKTENQDDPFSVPSIKKLNKESDGVDSQKNEDKKPAIKNLPSTVVKEEKPSTRNSLIVVFLIFCMFLGFWVSRSYGINTFVLIDFYLREFFFNLNLILSDLAKIIHNILN